MRALRLAALLLLAAASSACSIGVLQRSDPPATQISRYGALHAHWRGEIREALPRYEARVRELEPHGPSMALFNAHQAVAHASGVLGRYEAQLEHAQQAVALLDQITWYARFQKVEALMQVANAQSWLARPADREATLRRALAVADEMTLVEGSWGWKAYVQEALSGMLAGGGRHDEALAVAREAQAMRERIMRYANLIAWAYPSSASIARRWATNSNLVLANRYANLGREEDALRHMRRALALAERYDLHLSQAAALEWLSGIDERDGDGDTALARAETALAIRLRVAADAPGVAAGYTRVGRLKWHLGRPTDALADLQEAIRRHEEARTILASARNRNVVFEGRLAAYYLAVEVLLDLDRAADAFSVAERARARGFLDLLGMRATLSRPSRPDLLAEERTLRERIERVRELPDEPGAGPERARRLTEAREAYDRFLERLQTEDAEQASLTAVMPLTAGEVQALLPPGTALIEYFFSSRDTFIWVVRRDRLEARRLGVGEADLQRTIEKFRAAIGARDETATRALGSDLGRLLLAPLESESGVDHVIVVPHGPLHYLPFQALRRADGRYLAETVTVAYLPSASVLRFAQDKARSRAARAVVALGNPDRGLLERLPFAEAEVESLRRLFPDAMVLTRRDATRQRLIAAAPGARVLHVAAHAEFNAGDPLGSAILLTPDGPGDGRLEVQEIYGLDLAASLVVLSACETALGRISHGDEVIGLTRAFIYAGAPTVVTTLWKVDDRASFRLMSAFYRALAAGQSKARALRRAQLEIMAETPPPFFWAAYQLTGETDSTLPAATATLACPASDLLP